MGRDLLEVALGPMFACEWRVAARRGNFHLLRAGFVAVLLVSIGFAWYSTVQRTGVQSSVRQLALLGQAIFSAFAAVQLGLVMVIAPGATAGAICQDRARGTLLHLMVTDLTDREIVLGKIGARLMGMLSLILSAMPVMALMTLLGGIDPWHLAGAFAVTIGIAVLGCSMALLLSVWASKAHEVVMLVYLVWVGWLLAWPVAAVVYQEIFGFTALNAIGLGRDGWMARVNPASVLFGPNQPGSKIGLVDQLGFAAMTLVVSVVLIALATWRMRPSAMAERSRWSFRIPRVHLNLDRFLPGPSLDLNPVLWREWHRNRPSRWSRVVWWLYGLAAGGLTAWVLYSQYGYDRRDYELLAMAILVQVGVGLLLLSVSASTALAEERVRDSLDVLMTTPLSTRSIVVGKWLGGYRRAVWLAVLPGLVAIHPVLTTGYWLRSFLIVATVLVEGALVVSLGLWFATLTRKLGQAIGFSVATYVMIAVGWLFCIMILFPRGPSPLAEFLVGFSPLYNLIMLIDHLYSGTHLAGFRAQIYATIWVGVKSGLAMLIYAITQAGFERRLGRITLSRDPRAPMLVFPEKPTLAIGDRFPASESLL